MRPRLHVVRGFFDPRVPDEAWADAAREGYAAQEFTSTASPELPLHWHRASTIGYVLRGHGYVVDENGGRVWVAAGDKLVIPAGAVHAEGEVKDGEPVEWLSCWDNDKWLISNVSDILDPKDVTGKTKIVWIPPFSVVWKFAMQMIKSSLPTSIRSKL